MKHYIYVDEIESTNTYLKKNSEVLNNQTILRAKHQTHGRGRSHKTWIDCGENILFSILIKDNIPLDDLVHYPLITAIALHKVLSTYNDELMIKWPNDLLYRGLKVAGILCESIVHESKLSALIIGCGINIYHDDLPVALNHLAVDISKITSHEIHIDTLFNQCVDSIFNEIFHFKLNRDAHISYINQFNALKDRHISFIEHGVKKSAIALYISKHGELIVTHQNQILSILSGEVCEIKQFEK